MSGKRSVDYFAGFGRYAKLVTDLDSRKNRKSVAHFVHPANLSSDRVRFQRHPAHFQCTV